MMEKKFIYLNDDEVLEIVQAWYAQTGGTGKLEYADEPFSLDGSNMNKTFHDGEFVVGELKFQVID